MKDKTPEWIKKAIQIGIDKAGTSEELEAARERAKGRITEMIRNMERYGGKQTAQTVKVNYVAILARTLPSSLRDHGTTFQIFNAIDEYFEERNA